MPDGFGHNAAGDSGYAKMGLGVLQAKARGRVNQLRCIFGVFCAVKKRVAAVYGTKSLEYGFVGVQFQQHFGFKANSAKARIRNRNLLEGTRVQTSVDQENWSLRIHLRQRCFSQREDVGQFFGEGGRTGEDSRATFLRECSRDGRHFLARVAIEHEAAGRQFEWKIGQANARHGKIGARAQNVSHAARRDGAEGVASEVGFRDGDSVHEVNAVAGGAAGFREGRDKWDGPLAEGFHQGLQFGSDISAEGGIGFLEKMLRSRVEAEFSDAADSFGGELRGEVTAFGVDDDDFVAGWEGGDFGFDEDDAGDAALGELRADVIRAGEVVGEDQECRLAARALCFNRHSSSRHFAGVEAKVNGAQTFFQWWQQSARVDTLTMELTDLTAPEVRALSKDTPVVFPVAALEQHGQHLPLFTDSLLLGEVIRRAKEELKDRVLFAPLMWLGNSDHHLDFGGTLSASPRTYLEMLSDLAENFIHHGFRRIIFMNGHGGNDVPGRQATFELRQKHRERSDLLLLFGTYWLLGSKANEIDSSLSQSQMGHACEWETSMILRLNRVLVREYRQLAPVAFGNAFAPAHRAWVTQDVTEAGHIGSPHLASPEKGESLFRIFSADVIALLNRVVKWDGKSWEG